jgi:hypothetical protein
MRNTLSWSVLFAVLFLLPYSQLSAQQQDDMYEQGTVWSLTFIRTAPNQDDNYLNDLAKTWVASMEEAKAEGLVLDYKILSGNAANEDDYNLILMIENKNFASFDPDKDRKAKWDAINKKVREEMGDKFDTVVKNYDNIRDLYGSKVMRELHLKK